LNRERSASVEINKRYKIMRQGPQFVVTQKRPTNDGLVGLAPAPVAVTRLLMKIPSLHLQAWRRGKNTDLISSTHTFTTIY
jgi:hypothetical protein